MYEFKYRARKVRGYSLPGCLWFLVYASLHLILSLNSLISLPCSFSVDLSCVTNEGAERVKISRARPLTYKYVEMLLQCFSTPPAAAFQGRHSSSESLSTEALQLCHKSPLHHDCSVENWPYYPHFRAFTCILIMRIRWLSCFRMYEINKLTKTYKDF